MGTYYVSTAGDDGTGDGSSGNPWATIDHALNNAVDEAGTINVNEGTYDEDSASGWLQLDQAFSAKVTVQPWHDGDVVTLRDNASGTYTLRINGAENIEFKDIIIQPQAENTVATVFFQDADASNLTFTGCTIRAHHASSNKQIFRCSTITAEITGILLDGCTLEEVASGGNTLIGVSVIVGAGGTVGITIRDCTITGYGDVAAVQAYLTDGTGAITVTVDGGTFTSASARALRINGATVDIDDVTLVSTSGQGLVLGEDGLGTYTTTGTVDGVTVSSASSHAFMVGGGCDGVVVDDCDIDGGDHAFIFKECDNCTVQNSRFNEGTLSSLYFKAAVGCTADRCTIKNSEGGVCIQLLDGDTGNDSENCTVTHSLAVATGESTLFNWGGSGDDAGGGVCDYNTYAAASGKWGSLRGETLVHFASLLDAWDGYDVDDNDIHSTWRPSVTASETGLHTMMVLQPDASELPYVTFDQSLVFAASSGYFANAGSFRFNEEDRLAIAYSQGARRDGGEVTNAHGPLVDLSFTAVVSDTTRAGVISKADDLIQAVMNPSGGLLRFKPDGVGEDVLDTYYHYLQSPPPGLSQMADNRWDAKVNGEGVYRIALDVELKTLPFATSDPDVPIEVLAATTAYNVGDGSADYVTVLAASVKGDLPALSRIQITPAGTGASSLGRLWIAKRSKTLTSFEGTYLSSAAIAPTGVWSNQVDADRCGGSYERCTPAANGAVYGRRFTISSWDSHKGRAAVGVIVRSNGAALADFDIYYGWSIGNTPLYGEAKNVVQTERWELLLLGEVDIPETEMSELAELDLYIDVYVKRTSGDSTIDLDGLKLFYTDEAVLQVSMPAGYGASSTYKLLLENLTGEEIAHVLNASTDKLAYLLNAVGAFITCEPKRNTRLDLAWHRYDVDGIDEDWSGYNEYWMLVADFGDDEAWTGGSLSSLGLNITLTGGAGLAELEGTWTLAGWEDGDYVNLDVNLYYTGAPSVANLTVRFETTDTDYYEDTVAMTIGGTYGSDQMIKIPFSDFVATGNPSWSSVAKIAIEPAFTGGDPQIRVQDIRVSRADPDTSTVINETNGAWTTDGSGMKITDQMTGEDYAVIGSTGEYPGSADPYWWPTALKSDFRMVLSFELGTTVAVYFRSDVLGDTTEDYYYVSVTATYARLTEYNSGSDSIIVTNGLALTTGIRYYLGLLCVGSSIKAFVSTDESTLFQAENEVIDETDDTNTGTYIGIWSSGAYIGSVLYEPVGDLLVPADAVSVQAHAVFQTITPFHEE